MREIVVGVDCAGSSQRPLDAALVEAQAGGRPVRAVYAWNAPMWVGEMTGLVIPLPSLADSAKLAKEALDDVIGKSLAETLPSPVALSSEALPGDARHLLVDTSRDAGLLVVGGRGLGEVKSALLGSVTLHALHHATCPLMVVPESDAPAAPYQRVVVGADGSLSSRSAMRWALDAAVRHHCPLVVMHAWLLTTIPGRPPTHFVPSLREFETETASWLDQEIAEVLADRRGVDLSAELSHSSPAWALLDAAGPDDLLVVGSRGRGGFASLLLGSVASQCAQRARGVTVVVREGEERLET